MIINETESKSILRKNKKIDSWFISYSGMNLYRGCSHNCVYCDGRAEKYNVEGEFGKDIAVKINAAEILSRELNPKRKRKPIKKAFILLGGGVGDSYQAPERKYGLSRKTLELINHFNYPVHVLTKSTFVERDIDLLKKINSKKKALVSFSFATSDKEIASIFEPGLPSPTERLKTISRLRNEGISSGIFLMPVIPYISDSAEMIDDIIKKAKEAGAQFVIFGGMTLKEGRQKDFFMNVINKNFPQFKNDYERLYTGDKWGSADWRYYKSLNKLFANIADKYSLPKRIPPSIYKDVLSENDNIVVSLEHIDYFLKLREEKSPYSYGAYSISQLDQPVSSMKDDLLNLKGVGNVTRKIILEILDTGYSSYYRRLQEY